MNVSKKSFGVLLNYYLLLTYAIVSKQMNLYAQTMFCLVNDVKLFYTVLKFFYQQNLFKNEGSTEIFFKNEAKQKPNFGYLPSFGQNLKRNYPKNAFKVINPHTHTQIYLYTY